jgi:excinuclease ABC subunit B
VEIIRELRLGKFDVLIGVNLLREGLDIPEVSLVAILDADKEGFLRSTKSLIQTCGRAARNVSGSVIMYGDQITRSMEIALEETRRRRRIQEEFNRTHDITPTSIKKSIKNILSSIYEADYYTVPLVAETQGEYISPKDIPKLVKKLRKEMREAAQELDFERAALLRDRIRQIQEAELRGDSVIPAS